MEKVSERICKTIENENKQISIKNVRIAILGNVDSGKTSLVGVLSKGIQDDGRGEARKRVFNYNHEQANGRTSSIAHEIMGFTSENKQVLPKRVVNNKNKFWKEVMQESERTVSLIDLCGHEKYLKTTMHGMVAMDPNFAMIVIGSNMGLQRMTKEHLGITIALNIPFFVVFTKTDLAPLNVFQTNLQALFKILKSPFLNKTPIFIQDTQQLNSISPMNNSKLCPVFAVSNVNSQGIDLLIQYITILKPFLKVISNNDNKDQDNKDIGNNNDNDNDDKIDKEEENRIEFDINDNFNVTGVGTVVSGLIRKGKAGINKYVWLGPDRQNEFKIVQIKSIHINRTIAEEGEKGDFATLLIKPKNGDKLTRNMFRRGMFLIESKDIPISVWQFQAEISVLHHSSTIKEGYECVMHCRVIRQTVKIVSITDNNQLRTGDTAIVNFRFVYNSEFIKPGQIIIFREGRTKLQGVIKTLIYAQPSL